MVIMKCKQCQTHLVAYIHRELTPELRHQVAYHLDTCETCYRTYLQSQYVDQRLGQVIPQIGRANRPTLNRIWSSVQSEINYPGAGARPFAASYGVAALIMTLMLLIPLTMGNRNVPMVLPPTQPAPLIAQVTPNGTKAVESSPSLPVVSYTPEPRYSISGPSPDAITTPR